MIQTATLNINRTLSNFCRTVESESYERSRRVIYVVSFQGQLSTVLNNVTLDYVLILRKVFKFQNKSLISFSP